MYRRGYSARDLNSGAPIRCVQFVPRLFPRSPLYSFIISMFLITFMGDTAGIAVWGDINTSFSSKIPQQNTHCWQGFHELFAYGCRDRGREFDKRRD